MPTLQRGFRLLHILRPSSTGLRSRCSSGLTTRLTRPSSFASFAPTLSPSSSICMAALRERLRLSATIGVEQNTPIFTPGVAKRRVLARHGEIAGRDELAACRGGGCRSPPRSHHGFSEQTIDSIILEQACMILAKGSALKGQGGAGRRGGGGSFFCRDRGRFDALENAAE